MSLGAPHITVCIRIRPPNSAEGNNRVVQLIDDQSLALQQVCPASKRCAPWARRPRTLTFGFDRVFGETSTQEEVYVGATKGIIESVLEGYNATVFAYGATGSGKTHTMMGNDQAGPGIMGLAMRDLWNRIALTSEEFEHEVSVSCLEVYNENLRDLFVDEGEPLLLWEDTDGRPFVDKLSVQHPKTEEEVHRLLFLANSRRAQSPTDANSVSSRSHAVFQVTVTKKPRAAGTCATVLVGKLSLIDLAGSERAARTHNVGERLQEGANINKSLLALANCINALGKNYKSGQHIPFRNSKLTRLLKDSLGGACRTTMIANVSPSAFAYEDTHNTLSYAGRTKNIKVNAAKNQINVKAHLGQLKDLVDSLSAQVQALRGQLKQAEQERANCTCLARDPELAKFLDRSRWLFLEKAKLFRQLIGVERRIESLVQVVRPGELDIALVESYDSRDKLRAYIEANEKGLGRLMSDVENLPQAARQAVVLELNSISCDAATAQAEHAQHRSDSAVAVLRELLGSGLFHADHAIAIKMKTLVDVDQAIHVSIGTALRASPRRQSCRASGQSPHRLGRGSHAADAPHTPLDIKRPRSFEAPQPMEVIPIDLPRQDQQPTALQRETQVVSIVPAHYQPVPQSAAPTPRRSTLRIQRPAQAAVPPMQALPQACEDVPAALPPPPGVDRVLYDRARAAVATPTKKHGPTTTAAQANRQNGPAVPAPLAPRAPLSVALNHTAAAITASNVSHASSRQAVQELKSAMSTVSRAAPAPPFPAPPPPAQGPYVRANALAQQAPAPPRQPTNTFEPPSRETTRQVRELNKCRNLAAGADGDSTVSLPFAAQTASSAAKSVAGENKTETLLRQMRANMGGYATSAAQQLQQPPRAPLNGSLKTTQLVQTLASLAVGRQAPGFSAATTCSNGSVRNLLGSGITSSSGQSAAGSATQYLSSSGVGRHPPASVAASAPASRLRGEKENDNPNGSKAPLSVAQPAPKSRWPQGQAQVGSSMQQQQQQQQQQPFRF